MSTKAKQTDSHIRVFDALPPARSGGEMRALDYPHLYQIQAGDWRISYAVEHNRLAILVLEIVGSDGAPVKDPVREQITRKMKVKLLDWPEGSPSKDLPPEELGKKVKIKLLDLADDLKADKAAIGNRPTRVKLEGAPTRSHVAASKVKFVDSTPGEEPVSDEADTADPSELQGKRKVTPLNSPTV